MEYKIIIAGFGGQGVLFAGKVLAGAAMLKGYEVTWMPSYGPEMRGGTANCQIVVSDSRVGSPMVKNADMLMAMNVPSLSKFRNSAKNIITDERFLEKDDSNIISVNTSSCADGEYKGLTNMLMLGAFIKKTAIVELEHIKQTIMSLTKPHIAQWDILAVEHGYNMANA